MSDSDPDNIELWAWGATQRIEQALAELNALHPTGEPSTITWGRSNPKRKAAAKARQKQGEVPRQHGTLKIGTLSLSRKDCGGKALLDCDVAISKGFAPSSSDGCLFQARFPALPLAYLPLKPRCLYEALESCAGNVRLQTYPPVGQDGLIRVGGVLVSLFVEEVTGRALGYALSCLRSSHTQVWKHLSH